MYVQINKPLVFAFDAVEPRIKERMPGRLVLSLRNPTGADAQVTVMAESTSDADRPLVPGAPLATVSVAVAAGGTTDVVVPAVGHDDRR